ncbi:hypothetical protein H634G_07340 [Metarhizium anisopliae BRIP 53293]|uniref:Uncharacterized protein n=1 Tax=Metarhizium anisopliae BRIP 53293 TaxID=1291518 RepID=A0A0D9NUV3_METAN|nr:hypothetical protein H634G_07340 [Metarhizium anisopliae BRIP 53293]KJK85156.1 hypothetical protein H633G_11006 [Metarhizium anisopliae BRIP 53284]
MATESLESASSSPLSFYTANDSEIEESTTASSPTQTLPCPYRDARQLPRELKGHCHIFLEEQLYTCAINLLNSTLGSGTSRRSSSPRTVPIPPPSHLALLNTLIIHPIHTTRAEKSEYRDVAALALDYLRNLLTVVGPVNAGFRSAFQFHASPRWTRRSGFTSPNADSDMSDGDSDRDHDRLQGRMANEGSLWSRGQDLWATVGWAFNTSILYPQRWRHWRVWLEFMLDVLETDWAERQRQDEANHEANGGEGATPLTARSESMMAMYMEQSMDGHVALKRIIKALFADGGKLSSSTFPEVFEKEPRGPKKATRKRKREQVLDLENGKFGDYFDDDSISSGVSEPPTPQKPRDGRNSDTMGVLSPGLVESISIRLRFFKMLSAATAALRKQRELGNLYEDYVLAIKKLPLPLYSLYVAQRENPLLPEIHVPLIQELFRLLLPQSGKSTAKVDPEGDANGILTMPMLEYCYVPMAANTVSLEDNAKLSLLVENAIQLLWISDMIEYTDSFGDACGRGIRAREAKAKKKRTGKAHAESSDVSAKDVLTRSGERIRMLVQVLKETALDLSD